MGRKFAGADPLSCLYQFAYLIFSNISRYTALSSDSFTMNSSLVIIPFSMRSLVNASVCAKEEAINSCSE